MCAGSECAGLAAGAESAAADARAASPVGGADLHRRDTMELIQTLGTLFFAVVDTVVTGAPYLVYLLVAAWACALIFQIIHGLAGGR